MTATICCKCREDIESDGTSFECDGCVKTFHNVCDGVKKTDVNHRKASERLKIYCSDCCKSPQMANIENIKTMLKFIYKIDAQVQQQSMSQANVTCQMEKLRADVATVNGSIDVMKKALANTAVQQPVEEKKSFAAVTRAATNPAVIIKPKSVQQNSKTTIEDIKSHIDYKHIDVCDLRNVSGGGIAVTCASDASTLKIKSIIADKFGDKYDVKLPEKLKPRIKIVNVMNDVSDGEIVAELKRQNEWITDTDEIEVKKIIERKKDKNGNVDIILEVNIECFDNMMTAGKVKLGWKMCNVVHHVHITCCYNCCGFSHISTGCKNNLACGKYGLAHKTSHCKRKKVECVNCKSISEKLKIKLDCDHYAFSHKCPTLLKKIDRFARNFKTNEKQ